MLRPLIALTALLCIATSVHAQLVEDIEFRKDGPNAIVQIRFVAAVQYQKSITARSADLVQIFYNVLPGGDVPKVVSGERRAIAGVGLPQMVITDEAVSRDNPNARKLMVRFSEPTLFKVRAGRSKEQLELVLNGLAAVLQLPPPVPGMPAVPVVAAVPAVRPAVDRAGTPTITPARPAATDGLEVQAEQLLATSNAATDRGDYADAIAALKALLGLPPNTATRVAQAQIGIVLLQSGDAQGARGEFESFLGQYPVGPDSDQVRLYLANLPKDQAASKDRPTAEPVATLSGSVSAFFYGGQSKIQSQEFLDSPLAGLPVLQSQSDLSSTDQRQVQSNLDVNWRYRDEANDMRFVLRDTYSADLLPNRPSKNRLSALYFEQRSLSNGTSIKIGRQSPTGGGALYRFDGVQAGYVFAPKWKVNATYGVPTDALLDARRNFYGLSVDADALTNHLSGSLYLNQQMIDNEIDRRGVGAELRYFNEGVALSGQVDYDHVLQGMNILSMQGSWQRDDATVVNFLLDRRATPIRTLGNILFFQDPALQVPARNLQDLLATTPIDLLRGQVNGVTSFQNQATVGFTTPIAANWQTGANLSYTNVDEIKPVAVILPNGQPSTGDLWSLGMQLIGSNLYSSRDTHVLSANFLNGPTYSGVLLSYNNLTGISPELQLEPSLRFYTQTDSSANRVNRWSPGLRVVYRLASRVALESEISYEVSQSQGPLRSESVNRVYYYLGGRFDF